jgi:vacuolar-type H+-ATPase subunit C/Vma6
MANAMDALRYAGTNARVRGLVSGLLDDEAWRDLLRSRDLSTAIDRLRSTSYAGLVQAVEQSGALVLERIERRLLGRVAANCRKAMRFTQGAAHQLLLVWWQHFELENLKTLFRGLDHGMEPDAITRFVIPLGGYSTLPWDALLHERSVASLIDRLTGTHYINPLRNALPIYQREQLLFIIEVALDIRYYRDVAAAIAHLKGEERAAAQRILGTHLDMLNILWAFRHRVYYHLSAEEIVNYTLWHTMRTDASLIREIALGATPLDVVSRVWGSRALDTSLFEQVEDEVQMLPALELALRRYWRHLAKRELSGFPFSLGAVLGYLVLEELEAHDLIATLEGKGMGWEAERIQQHLIRYKE